MDLNGLRGSKRYVSTAVTGLRGLRSVKWSEGSKQGRVVLRVKGSMWCKGRQKSTGYKGSSKVKKGSKRSQGS